MRIRTLSTLAVAVALAGAALAADPAPVKKVTVQGEILDMACYVSHEAKGPSHADCAASCLKGGQPMGLLARNGTVYLLFADHSDAAAYNKAKDFGGKNVEIQGEASARGAIQGITVTSVKPL